MDPNVAKVFLLRCFCWSLWWRDGKGLFRFPENNLPETSKKKCRRTFNRLTIFTNYEASEGRARCSTTQYITSLRIASTIFAFESRIARTYACLIVARASVGTIDVALIPILAKLFVRDMPSSLRDPFAICFIFLARVGVIARWAAPLFACGTEVLCQLCLPAQQAHGPTRIAHTSVSHIAIPARLLGLVYIDVIHAHGAQRQGLQAGRQTFHRQTASPPRAGRRTATVHFLARRPRKAWGALASAGLAIAESIGGALHQSVHVLGNLVVGTIVLGVVPDDGPHRRADGTGARGAVG